MSPVLVVEDNLTIRQALVDLLRLEGLDTAEAGHGEEAIARLAEGPRPCTIVLDLMMPVMDGWAFLDWLRGSAYRSVPVVVLTALGFEGDGGALARELGCPVLRKTGDLRAMVRTVRTFCGG